MPPKRPQRQAKAEEEIPALPPIRLPDEPSKSWMQYRAVVLLGGAIPLSLLFRFPPGEVELIYAIGLLKRFQQWQQQLEEAGKLRGRPVPGMTIEEADAIRSEVSKNLETLLRIWTPHYERSQAALQDAMKKGYL